MCELGEVQWVMKNHAIYNIYFLIYYLYLFYKQSILLLCLLSVNKSFALISGLYLY